MPLVFGRSILGFGVVAGPPAPTWTDPDIANASYDSVSFSVASQDTLANGFVFGDDGTKAYVSGHSTDTVYQYTLTTAYDISTASYASKSFNVNTQEPTLRTARFSPDGGSMYIFGNTNRTVYQYTLSTNWDVSTASYASKSMSAATQSTYAVGFVFNNDGTKIFVTSSADDRIYEYLLTTAYDVSTGSYNNASALLTGAASNINPQEVAFNDDGTKMYVTCITNDNVYEFGLTSAFDISTASYSSISFDVSSQADQAMDITFNPSGSKMFIMDAVNDTVYQYSVAPPTWTNPDLTTASYDSVSFSVATELSIPDGLEFNSDGTKMYGIGQLADKVFEYDLSTAWDVSTASYNSVFFSTTSQMTAPVMLRFNPDGTKLYVLDQASDDVFQYSLSTAFDVSTMSYASLSFSATTQTNNPLGMDLNDDGTKFYIAHSGGEIFQYTLSTAYDISTASYDSVSFDSSTEDTNLRGFRFNPDGTKLFTVGNTNNKVFQYSLSTAFNLSTASYDSVSFSITQDGSPADIAFKTDGSKMYLIGFDNDTVYQYST